MDAREPKLPFVPKRAAADALAALESLRFQDKLVRRLVRPELEPFTTSGQSGV